MIITEEEKKILAQKYFEDCIKQEWFSINGISDFYNCISPNGKNIYENKEDEKLVGYNDLRIFHIVEFKDFPESTFIKILTTTKNIFAQMGYIVDDSKLLEKWKRK